MMRSIFSTIIFLLLLSPIGTSLAAPSKLTVAEVTNRMQNFYNKTKDLKGEFKQVYSDTLYNRQRTSYGYVYVKKPGMMRWNYVKPEKKSFIADGKELWVWEPEDKQAFRNPLNSGMLSTGLTFLLGTGNLSKEFTITFSDEKLGAPEDIILKLTPKNPTTQYKYLLFALRPSDYAVGESMIVGKHNTNHFVFSNMLFNTRVQNGVFFFRPPVEARVIDGARLK